MNAHNVINDTSVFYIILSGVYAYVMTYFAYKILKFTCNITFYDPYNKPEQCY